MGNYGYRKQVNLEFEEAVARITEELKREGFGVLARLDIDRILKEKLGVDLPRYAILEACNPPNAKRSLELEPEIGLLLPCNVIVYERDGAVYVAIVRATKLLSIVGNERLDEIAQGIETKMKQALERV